MFSSFGRYLKILWVQNRVVPASLGEHKSVMLDGLDDDEIWTSSARHLDETSMQVRWRGTAGAPYR